MKKITKFILGFSLLIASGSASAFSFKSSDFGTDDYDDDGDSWGSSPMSWSSGRWDTGPWGGGPFNTDSRNWGNTPWNSGGRNNYMGGRNSPWSNTPWNGDNRNWRGNSGPWNRGIRGYGNPYQRGPYGGGYGNPYPYNVGPGIYQETPYLPQAPATPGVEGEIKQ